MFAAPILRASALLATLGLFSLSLPAAQAAPSRLSQRDFFCDTKSVHCCDQLLTGEEAAKSFGDLLALPSSLLGNNVGLGCAPIGLANLGSCAKSQPVCCSQVYQDGLINIGCTPLSVL